MSGDLAGEITAIATAVLAVFAIITAVFAVLAYGKQYREVEDQGHMLNLQGHMLTLQRAELDEQRKINAEQTRVLELQAKELGESLAERKRAQASHVIMWTESDTDDPHTPPGRSAPDTFSAHIKNTSKQPIYDVQINWNQEGIPRQAPDWQDVLMPDNEKTGVCHLPPLDQPDVGVIAARRDLIVRLHAKKWPVARFRDAAGRLWRLRPSGQLDEDLDFRWTTEAMFGECAPDEQPATGQPDDGTP